MKKVRAGWLALLGFGCFCSWVERAFNIFESTQWLLIFSTTTTTTTTTSQMSCF
jgi:hypothetical protein